MKIMYLTTGIDVGGAETQLLLLCETMKKRGHTIMVCSMTEPKELAHEFESQGVLVFSLGMNKGVPSFNGFIKWIKLVLNYKPDIVHSHMIHANLMSRFANILLRKPLVNTAHSVVEGGRLLEFAYRVTKYIPSLFTHVSADGYDAYVKKKLVHKKKFFHLNNGIQLPMNIDSTSESLRYRMPFRFIHVGRLEDVKNQRLLLASFSKLKGNYILDILGDGTLRRELETYAYELGITDKVVFHGAVRNVEYYLSRADAFVLTSKYEGLPMAVLEAMAYCIPVISTDVGDIPKLVIDKSNGFLVKKHTPEEFSKALEAMMTVSDDGYSKMCNLSFQIVSREYSMEGIVARWDEIYSRLIQTY